MPANKKLRRVVSFHEQGDIRGAGGTGGSMIYTLTLNPTLDITYVVEEISFGEPVRAVEVLKSPGGKGINVSRVLRAMGTDSVAMGMTGGYVGEEVLDLLQEEGLILQITKIKSETRTNVIVLGKRDGRQLVVRAAGPPVDKAEVDKVVDTIFMTAQAPEILVLSGSLPPGMSNDMYHEITVEGKSRGSKVVIDSEGPPLAAGVTAGPYLIKPNLTELQELAGTELSSDADIVAFCRKLNAGGIEMVVVSLGADGALMVTSEVALQGVVPRLTEDTVGAGDSMVAGMVIGIVQGLPLERTFHMGLAASVAAVMNHGPGLTNPENFATAFPQVKVKTI